VLHDMVQWGILWTRGWTFWFINSENFLTRSQNYQFFKKCFPPWKYLLRNLTNYPIGFILFHVGRIQTLHYIRSSQQLISQDTVLLRNRGALHKIIKYCLIRKTELLILSKKRLHFQRYSRSWKEHKLGRGSRRGSKPSTTVLARASSNLLDCTGLWYTIHIWNLFYIVLYILRCIASWRMQDFEPFCDNTFSKNV
jgi:hypothetical protein